MKQELVNEVLQEMQQYLDNAQIKQLERVMLHSLYHYQVEKTTDKREKADKELVDAFIAAKRIEGCSEKTITYYQKTIETMMDGIGKAVLHITTDDLRAYLMEYQSAKSLSKVTVDNIRRILSSFFSWLEDEDYIIKSPVRRIHKIKTATNIKETYSDENLEKLRDGCHNIRDLAMIDFLSSTGVRVGELVNLNIDDIDFINQSCVVLGKGNKEREVYFDARAKLHLQNYLKCRTDDNPALFVTLNDPHKRLKISGVEIRLRQLGRELKLERIHPHKFRRTMATRAIDKGMPIEQVQKLLGHQQIDTTMQYAMVNQSNVKTSHRRFIA